MFPYNRVTVPAEYILSINAAYLCQLLPVYLVFHSVLSHSNCSILTCSHTSLWNCSFRFLSTCAQFSLCQRSSSFSHALIFLFKSQISLLSQSFLYLFFCTLFSSHPFAFLTLIVPLRCHQLSFRLQNFLQYFNLFSLCCYHLSSCRTSSTTLFFTQCPLTVLQKSYTCFPHHPANHFFVLRAVVSSVCLYLWSFALPPSLRSHASLDSILSTTTCTCTLLTNIVFITPACVLHFSFLALLTDKRWLLENLKRRENTKSGK